MGDRRRGLARTRQLCRDDAAAIGAGRSGFVDRNARLQRREVRPEDREVLGAQGDPHGRGG